MRMMRLARLQLAAPREDGFTMIVAIMIMFVTSLIVAGVFVGADGDIKATHTDTLHKKAYYAALAGLNAYKYQLSSEPLYWRKCPSIPAKESSKTAASVPGTSDETYKVITVHSSGHTQSECESEKQTAIIETSGSATGNFRVESTGKAGSGAETATRTLVATFSHPGYLNYVYLTNYEVLDPYAQSPEPTDCKHYHAERESMHITDCTQIQFAPNDKVNGPMHTNDAADICAEGSNKPTFGRSSSDKIEWNGGHFSAGGSCSNSPNIVGTYTEKGPTLLPPETDDELLEEASDKFEGRTYFELKSGTPNTIAVTKSNGTKETINFPSNGVIYVANQGSCPVKYTPFGTNYEGDEKCGNAYVKGNYTESLTVAAEDDVIIDGNVTTTSEPSGKPTGTGTLGLIANEFVRIYHPVEKEYEVEHYKPQQGATNSAHECPLKYKGKLTSGSATVTNLSSVESLSPGMEVWTATGLPSGDKIKEVNTSAKTIVLYSAATESKEVELMFQAPIASEVKGKITSGSTTVTGLTNTEELRSGMEVTGTGIAAGSTISEVNRVAKTLVLSVAATSTTETTLSARQLTELKGTTSSGSTSVTVSSTSGLGVGMEVSGTGIPAGARITKVEGSKTIVLTKAATSSKEGTTLKFLGSSYSYNAGAGKCVPAGESGYTYHESESLYSEGCASNKDTYTSNGKCAYENNSSGCDAENSAGIEDPTNIDAAILSTNHSFIVDNYKCGKHIGELTVWGSIAQYWRGPVGVSGSSSPGYTKNYNYDERLETLQPPDFLTPTSSTVKLARVTSPPASFGEA